MRSSRSSARALRAALVLLLLAAPRAAHDHWIAPSSFHPTVGERVELAFRVGHPGQFEEQLRDPRRFVRFDCLPPAGAPSQPVLGLDGKPPAGLLRPKAPGAHLVVYQSAPAFVELEPGKYAEFLATEGLDDVAAEREARGELALPGRDSYARFDKALLCVGDTAATEAFARVVGLPLELVLESDPGSWRAQGSLTLRLLYEGRALAGRQVKLVALEAPHQIVLARTDAEGRVSLTPTRAGAWCAFAVHQRRAPAELGLPGDWQSFWASYAFELRTAPGLGG